MLPTREEKLRRYFLFTYPSMNTTPDAVDEELARVKAAATVAALDLNERLTLDEDMILQVSQEDPTYQLLVARGLAGDWHPQGSQEIA